LSGVVFVNAKFGKGAQINTAGTYFSIRKEDVDSESGTISFWFKPTTPHSDYLDHALVANLGTDFNPGNYYLGKSSDNRLYWLLIDDLGISHMVVVDNVGRFWYPDKFGE